jgi:endonuclease G
MILKIMNSGLYYFIFFIGFYIYPQEYYKNSYNGDLISHSRFSLSYIEEHEQAEWVYYKLNPDLLKGFAKRTNNFRADSAVKTGSAEIHDYRKSGYDRGHLAPAGDMKSSKKSMSESFFMSNISPQQPSFNRGGWKKLETLVRSWATNSEIHIVTGGILIYDLKKIGRNEVSVPDYFYKIIFDHNECKMIGFVMPNKKITKKIKNYVKTVDEIEMLTGIDFFYDLFDDIENELESVVKIKDWNFE